jgi:hypothetical protein
MGDKQESPKDPSRKEVYVKPKLREIPLNDEKALLEFCEGKPFDVEELKKLIKGKLNPEKGQ